MSLHARLKEDLNAALRRRDRTEIEVLRTLISAIDNAGAVEAVHEPLPKLGLDFDVPRREIDIEEQSGIVAAERDELIEAAESYRGLGLVDEAAELESKAAIAARYLG